jgi:hypothetical protein
MAWPSTTSTLIDPDVGAGAQRLDHRERMPVVGRRHEDRVEVALGEHAPVVGVGSWLPPRGLARGDLRRGVRQHPRVDVADRDDLDRRDLQEAEEGGLAVPAGADQAHAQRRRVRERRSVSRRGRERERGRARPQELSSLHGGPPAGAAIVAGEGRRAGGRQRRAPIYWRGLMSCGR